MHTPSSLRRSAASAGVLLISLALLGAGLFAIGGLAVTAVRRRR